MRALIILASLILFGCSYMAGYTDESAEKLGKAVAAYCRNIPETQRDEYRPKVNLHTEGATIKVTCPGDTD